MLVIVSVFLLLVLAFLLWAGMSLWCFLLFYTEYLMKMTCLSMGFSVLLNKSVELSESLTSMGSNLGLWFQDKSWESINELISGLLPYKSILRTSEALEAFVDEGKCVCNVLWASLELFTKASLKNCKSNWISKNAKSILYYFTKIYFWLLGGSGYLLWCWLLFSLLCLLLFLILLSDLLPDGVLRESLLVHINNSL